MDYKDITVLCLVVFIVVSAWTWVWVHPSTGAYCTAVGGTGAFGVLLHLIYVHDDKLPDRKQDNAP